MRKWEIEQDLKFLGVLKTNTLSAQEDLALLRLTQSLSEQYNKLNKDKELIAGAALVSTAMGAYKIYTSIES